MKLSFVFLFATFLQLHAKSYSQITISGKNIPIEVVFGQIKKQTGYTFWYEDKLLKRAGPVTINVQNATLEETLSLAFRYQNLGYEIIGKNIALEEKNIPLSPVEASHFLSAEDRRGRVINDRGEPLEGVTVTVKGTNKATATNSNGEFSLSNIPRNATLIFSSQGYISQTVNIDDHTDILVKMVIETKALSDVIVTALGISREKKSIGFAAQEMGKKDLSEAREVNVANYLTGKIAGVQVSKSSAGTGGSSRVLIRGVSSLKGENQPLYVVDGIPMDNTRYKEATYFGSGQHDFGDGISNLNPQDIESMTVLKGPNATALYGSRGSNGVIVIITKSAKAGRGVGVELNSNVTMEKINLFPNVQNKYAIGYEDKNVYGNLIDIDGKSYETIGAGETDSYGPPLDGKLYVNPFVFDPTTAPTTFPILPQPKDNIRDFWNTGLTTNNSIALSGGNDKASARMSVNNTTIQGITPNHNENMQSVNLRAGTKINEKLSFDGKVNYVSKKVNNAPAIGSSTENIVYDLATMGRFVPMDFLREYYEKTGTRGKFPNVLYNPYYIVNELKNTAARDRLISFGSVKYQITSWLGLAARSGIDFYTERRNQKWPVGALGQDNANGRLTDETYYFKENNTDVLLTAVHNKIKNFSASLSVGGAFYKRTSRQQAWDANTFKVPGIYDVSNAKNLSANYSLIKKEIQSAYFTGQVAYREFLFLDVTGRNDWSSTLGADNYSFFYPSVSSSFLFTNALNLRSRVLTYGKLRASYAEAGNDADPYQTVSGYQLNSFPIYGQSYALQSNVIAAFNLKNELKRSIEFGTELRFFNDRIGLDATVYKSNTLNQILNIPISNSSGYLQKVVNAGNVQNKGLEVSLRGTPVQSKNGLTWDVAFNFSKNQSKVLELAPGIETVELYSTQPNTIEARIGQPYGNIVGYKYKRAPDGQKIVDESGAYVREDNTSILGNATPKWIGGLNNTLNFKGFSLNFLIDFVQGNQITSNTRYQMVGKGTGAFTEEGREHSKPLDGVIELKDADNKVTGYETNTKTVDGQTYWANRAWGDIGEEFVLDGSFVMLREVILGYSFSPSFIKKTPFTNLRVSLVGRNLWYIEEHMQGMGISPETILNTSATSSGVEAESMPTTRGYGINLNVTF